MLLKSLPLPRAFDIAACSRPSIPRAAFALESSELEQNLFDLCLFQSSIHLWTNMNHLTSHHSLRFYRFHLVNGNACKSHTANSII